MAVARMLKVSALAHRSVTDEVVGRLQRAGVIQIETSSDSGEGGLYDNADLYDIEEQLGRAEFVRDFLRRFREPDVAFSTFVSEKVHVDEERFLGIEADDEFHDLYRECEGLSARLAEIVREREHAKALVHALTPWSELRLQIPAWRGTEHVALFAGTVHASRGPEMRVQLQEAVSELSIEELGPVGTRQAWVVMVHRDHEEEVRSMLALTDFEEVSFPGLSDYPAEEIRLAQDRLSGLEEEQAELTQKAAALAEKFKDVFALVEALHYRHDGLSIRDCFGTTGRTFAIEGWVPEADKEKLELVLAQLDHVDVAVEEPGPEDEPPVLLRNPAWLRPFEVVTDLYGRPRYRDTDPTPLLALWFAFFFGMAIGDFGYGLVLIAVALLIKHRLDVAPGVRKFQDLLVYGGIASCVVGVFTGSYFAVSAESLPAILQRLIIVDLVQDVATVLVFSVCVGILHVMLGVVIKFRDLIRKGEVVDAIMDEASTLLLWGSIGAAAVAPEALRMTIAGAGAGLTLLLKGRVLLPPYGLRTLAGLGSGLLGIYGTLTGFLSDFLSYTRLAALGMASLLVGWVMNMLAGLIPRTGPWYVVVFGSIIALAILIVGHAFNVAMSLLGAFVHSLRLQFVEFFSKFYEGGGIAFRPFGLASQVVVLRREAAQEEGG